jgi:RNA polymerase sigma factor (sigma-70 family)
MAQDLAADAFQAVWPALVHNSRPAGPHPLARSQNRAMSSAHTADEALRASMVGYQAGDREAFEQLHGQLSPILQRYLLRLARDPARVDDLLQETFLHLHRARHTYDPAFPVTPWACAIARHVFLMDCRYRSRRADLVRQAPLDEAMAESRAAHEDALMARTEVRHALAQLSPATRRSVLLHHLHGLSFKEMSRRLQARGPALRARASRGMARLREVLEHDKDRNDRT